MSNLDKSFLYRLGFEYGVDPESHDHFDGCGHSGEGVEAEFLRGWQEARATLTEEGAPR